MTEIESILLTLQNGIVCATDDITRKDLEMMVKCLEELQQYRAIGTVEGYKIAIETSIGNYNLYKKYKAKTQEFEAIGTVEEITKLIKFLSFDDDTSILEDLQMLTEYYAIGTIDEFKALKEKNEPKEVAYQIDTSGHKHEKCPACGSFNVFGKHCTECGQSIVEWWQ